jgi:hypothetical protein
MKRRGVPIDRTIHKTIILLSEQGFTNEELGMRFDIHPGTVWKIVTRHRERSDNRYEHLSESGEASWRQKVVQSSKLLCLENKTHGIQKVSSSTVHNFILSCGCKRSASPPRLGFTGTNANGRKSPPAFEEED